MQRGTMAVMFRKRMVIGGRLYLPTPPSIVVYICYCYCYWSPLSVTANTTIKIWFGGQMATVVG